MAVDYLDAPLRTSWDLYAADGSTLPARSLVRIAQQQTSAGVFFVTLESHPLAHPDIGLILETLLAGGCQVSLVIYADPEQIARLHVLPKGINLYLDAAAAVTENRLDQKLLQENIQQIRALGGNPALLWIPQHGQLPLILDFIRFCTENSLPRFKLPNHKIDVNSQLFNSEQLPNCQELAAFAALLERVELPKSDALQLEVHDLFLWELLQPLCGGERSEYGGCQAANSLGHISADGDLFPCSSWPQALGNLLTAELLDLWQSDPRFAIRKQIALQPAGCDGCHDYQICFGGCRGLSTFCRADDLGRDLLCAERR